MRDTPNGLNPEALLRADSGTMTVQGIGTRRRTHVCRVQAMSRTVHVSALLASACQHTAPASRSPKAIGPGGGANPYRRLDLTRLPHQNGTQSRG